MRHTPWLNGFFQLGTKRLHLVAPEVAKSGIFNDNASRANWVVTTNLLKWGFPDISIIMLPIVAKGKILL